MVEVHDDGAVSGASNASRISLSGRATYGVLLRDVNEPPTLAKELYRSTSPDARDGDAVGKLLRASDDDEDHALRFALVHGTPCEDTETTRCCKTAQVSADTFPGGCKDPTVRSASEMFYIDPGNGQCDDAGVVCSQGHPPATPSTFASARPRIFRGFGITRSGRSTF